MPQPIEHRFDPSELQRREYKVHVRAVEPVEGDEDLREIEGIAVPYGEVADIGWFTEEVERGAVQDSADAQFWWRHNDPIGLITKADDQEGGWHIRARVSKTALGDDALTLARDGVVNKLSIGFESREYKIREASAPGERDHITHTNIRVREVSLVPLPAYTGAQVTGVRSSAQPKGKSMPDEAIENDGIVSVIDREARDSIAELERRFAVFGQRDKPDELTVRKLSPGEVLKRLAAGDEAITAEYNELMVRAYTGGTTADSIIKNGWVGDLTRLIEEANPLLSWFSQGALPEEGLKLEYAQLKSNTVTVEEQVNEGDDLVYGKVQLETKTADIKTYGGYTELSRREIERSSVNILDVTLAALAGATGQRMGRQLRAKFLSTYGAQAAAGDTVEIPAGADWADWLDATVDAAIKFSAIPIGLPIDGLITNASVFKALLRLEAADGRPVLKVEGTDSVGNVVGSINPVHLRGQLASLEVVLDAGLPLTAEGGAARDIAAFANKRALRSYISPVTRLQDENIINLSKQFSVYNYAAFANEIPSAIVPVVKAP